jgi:hypothetical protein
MVAGIFDLKTKHDLLEKLKHDYRLMVERPSDSYLAFNFFVTAEAMLDWIYPGNTNRKNRELIKNNEELLQITSHIASGAKHFTNLSNHHDSVGGTGKASEYFSTYFPTNYFPSYFGKEDLIIFLDGDASVKLGVSIPAVELAEKILAYWETSTLLK